MNVNNVELSTLIDLVEKFRFLWDKKDLKFKDKIAVENAWATIAHIMEIPIKEAQELWEYLKSKYVRERRVKKNIPSGSAGITENTWELYERLGFLDTVIQTRRAKSNIVKKIGKTTGSPMWEDAILGDDGMLLPTNELNKDSEEIDYERDEEIIEMLDANTEQEPSTSSSSTIYAIPNITPKRRIETHKKESKKQKKDQSLEMLLGTCNQIGNNINNLIGSNTNPIDTNDEDNQFLISLLPSFKNISNEAEKLKLKANFLLQLAAIEEKNSQ